MKNVQVGRSVALPLEGIIDAVQNGVLSSAHGSDQGSVRVTSAVIRNGPATYVLQVFVDARSPPEQRTYLALYGATGAVPSAEAIPVEAGNPPVRVLITTSVDEVSPSGSLPVHGDVMDAPVTSAPDLAGPPAAIPVDPEPPAPAEQPAGVPRTPTLEFVEMLKRTDDHPAIRVTFKAVNSDDVYVVVKFFDPDQSEKWTVKVFGGSYASVRAHWNTSEPMSTPDEVLISRAMDHIRDAAAAISTPVFAPREVTTLDAPPDTVGTAEEPVTQ